MVNLKPLPKPTKKSTETTREKIIAMIENNSEITIKELADHIEISERGIDWHIKNQGVGKSSRQLVCRGRKQQFQFFGCPLKACCLYMD